MLLIIFRAPGFNYSLCSLKEVLSLKRFNIRRTAVRYLFIFFFCNYTLYCLKLRCCNSLTKRPFPIKINFGWHVTICLCFCLSEFTKKQYSKCINVNKMMMDNNTHARFYNKLARSVIVWTLTVRAKWQSRLWLIFYYSTLRPNVFFLLSCCISTQTTPRYLDKI